MKARQAMDAYVVGYLILVGVAVVGLWAALFATRQVPEVTSAPWSLALHVTAEAVMAGALLLAGWTLWRGGAPDLAWFGLGMAVYSMINSAGYYAQRREWPPVILFAILLIGAVLAMMRLGSAG